MPILNLTALTHDGVRVRDEIPPDDPGLVEAGLALNEPVRVDLDARSVGEGVLVRGGIRTEVAAECRRCLVPVTVRVEESIDVLFEPLSDDEEVELGGEVYPLPERGDRLDLTPAIREQLLLKVPDFVVCTESCKGLCPQCGADLNHVTCECVPETGPGPWDALKKIKFD